MKNHHLIRGWRLLAILSLVVSSACANQTLIPEVDPVQETPIATAILEVEQKPSDTATVPKPSATEIVMTASPSPIIVTDTPAPTAAVTETAIPTELATAEPSVIADSSPNGVWISDHDKRGARTWIQFEVYSKEDQSKLDVLEACINYSCEYMGEIFIAEGCSGDKSPKGIPIRNGKFTIDFHGILPENLTHHSRLGMIYGQILDNQVITGTWIIPVCDYWLPFDVRYTAETATP